MLTPEEIVLQLQTNLPLFTDRFHDELPVTSGSVSSGILTIVTTDEHRLQPGDQVNIPQAIIRNLITGVIENADETVSYTTQDEHDLTAYSSEGHGNTWPDGLKVTLETGSGNVEVDLLPGPEAVPHENEFVGVVGSIQFTPSGNEYLLENRAYGVGGVKTVATVPDVNTITVDLSDVPGVPDGPVIMSYIITNPRVTTVTDLERAEDMYTKIGGNDAWLFVIMLDRRPSKGRQNDDDLTSLPGSTLRLMNIMQDYSTLVMLPTNQKVGGTDAKTWAYVDLFIILNQVLYGWEETGYNGDGQVIYDTSVYGHAFEWQTRQQIDWTNGYINGKTTALRQMNFTQTVFDEGESSGEIKYP